MTPIYDPYDIWSTPFLGKIKSGYTGKSILSIIVVPIVGMFEITAPILFRKMIGVRPHKFAHVEAMRSFEGSTEKNIIQFLDDTAIKVQRGVGWGLPFRWYSKNGSYSARTAYVTNTPYVMEALLSMPWSDDYKSFADEMFQTTWDFLESLRILHSTDDQLALSYAPIDEPRCVNNANSYAALSYALHAIHGREGRKDLAASKAMKLVSWIGHQQNVDGSWHYYADNAPGNFIDCFHSCFVIKNLIKVRSLLSKTSLDIDYSIDHGWKFITDHFFDHKSGLCRRFVERDIKDPFRWDIYDQAEYLGLLIDFGLFDEAKRFSAHVEQKFRKGNNWYCRIDIIGRRWGKNFMRWGIVPFQYHKARLDTELAKAESLCVA